MFGSHLSIAGSVVNALDEAERLDLDTVQIFTKNQQQWKAKPLDPGVVRDWLARLAALGWTSRTVSHASYLINLASPDDALWRKSIDLMVDEVERCAALSIPYLVHHPGAHTTAPREHGLARIAEAYREIFARTAGVPVVSCLENTVGGGSNLGRDFTELAALRDRIADATGAPQRLGVCFDTCHAHAGGYDLSSGPAAKATLAVLDQTVGLSWVRVLHVNDSKAALGSKLDRHEHIGSGTIGGTPAKLDGFAAVVTHPAFADVPKIMETPKGDDADGTPFDTLNLRRLRGLFTPSDADRRVPPRSAWGSSTPVAQAAPSGKPPRKPAPKTKPKPKPKPKSTPKAAPKPAPRRPTRRTKS